MHAYGVTRCSATLHAACIYLIFLTSSPHAYTAAAKSQASHQEENKPMKVCTTDEATGEEHCYMMGKLMLGMIKADSSGVSI